MNNDDVLNKILMKREIPAPATNLAYRISQAALDKRYGVGDGVSWSDQLLRLFILPKPAYITAFFLLFGLAIGIYTGVENTTGQDWFSFLDEQEGEWL